MGNIAGLIVGSLSLLLALANCSDQIGRVVTLQQHSRHFIYYSASAGSLSGEIFSPDYPNRFTTESEAGFQIFDLPNTQTWVELVYLPVSPEGVACDGFPFTAGNSTVDSLLHGPSCINLYKKKQSDRILITKDIVIKLPPMTNEPAFKITYNVSTFLLPLTPMERGETVINGNNSAGYIMSHPEYDFSLVTLSKSTQYSLTLELPPTTTSVKLRLIDFIIGHNTRALCESEGSRNDPNNDHFSISSGSTELYRCSGGVIWGNTEMLTFDNIRNSNLRFTLNTSSNISYAGFFIRYDVTSCDYVPYSSITRGRSASDFIITCDDGQIGTYQCIDGLWSPQMPVCNPDPSAVSCSDVPNSVITLGYPVTDLIVTCDDGYAAGTFQCNNGLWEPYQPACNSDPNPGVILQQGVTRHIYFSQSAGSFTGEIFTPGYPNRFSTANESTVIIHNLPKTKTWVQIVYLPPFTQGVLCRGGFPFTAGNSTVDRLLYGPSCINLYKKKQVDRILITDDIVIKLPAIANEPGFKISFNVSTILLPLTPMERGETVINGNNSAGYIMSHPEYDFGWVTLSKSTQYSLTLELPPTTTSVKLRLIDFIIGHNTRALCESEGSRNDPNNDHFSISSGSTELYRCSGGVIWGDTEMLTFDNIRNSNLRFTLNTSSNITYAGFFIRYDVISCEDVPNSVITPGHSASEFIVTCDDGQVETYQCTNGVWTPQKPVCNHASNTDRGMTCQRNGRTYRRLPSVDCSTYSETNIHSLHPIERWCQWGLKFDLQTCQCNYAQYVNCHMFG